MLLKNKDGTNNFSGNKEDNYTTPKIAWELIFQYISCDTKKVWQPFFNEGTAGEYLKELNINSYHEDKDFFDYEPEFDYLIDNPPYSIKERIFKRCIELDKPFALLLPMDTLERRYFKKLFDGKDLTIIIPNKRFNFYGGENKGSAPFKTAWFCYNFNLGQQLIFQ